VLDIFGALACSFSQRQYGQDQAREYLQFRNASISLRALQGLRPFYPSSFSYAYLSCLVRALASRELDIHLSKIAVLLRLYCIADNLAICATCVIGSTALSRI
jgi:hypothetical protein